MDGVGLRNDGVCFLASWMGSYDDDDEMGANKQITLWLADDDLTGLIRGGSR